MLENNEMDREVRQYLIQVEEAWNEPDMVIARALQAANHKMQVYKSKVTTLQLVVAEQKIKVEAYDSFMCGKNSLPVGVVAKAFGIGRNRLFQMLRDAGILMQDNVPYQDYEQYFEVILKPVKIRGEIVNKPVTLITPRGVSYLIKRFKFAVSA